MNSVCKDVYGAFCCETKLMNLTIAILDFGVHLYSGSELKKTDAKTGKISKAVCKRDWHNVRLYLFFNVRIFRMKFLD